jgi:ABC-type glutathione transport system ATPase component
MPSREDALLDVADLRKFFPVTRGIIFQRKVGEVRAVDGVSFNLMPGETFGIVGETGCGKSTTGRLIARLLDVSSGRVMFEGREITHLNARQMRPIRRDIQMIFQDPYSSLNPRHNIGTIVGAPFRLQGVSSAAASVNASVSREHSRCVPSSSSVTSRSLPSTSPSRRRSSTCSKTCRSNSA